MPRLAHRRDFLKQTGLAGGAVFAGGYFSMSVAESKSPNEKLNIGCIGTANQARFSGRSAITPNGFAPARPAVRRPATSTIPAR